MESGQSSGSVDRSNCSNPDSTLCGEPLLRLGWTEDTNPDGNNGAAETNTHLAGSKEKEDHVKLLSSQPYCSFEIPSAVAAFVRQNLTHNDVYHGEPTASVDERFRGESTPIVRPDMEENLSTSSSTLEVQNLAAAQLTAADQNDSSVLKATAATRVYSGGLVNAAGATLVDRGSCSAFKLTSTTPGTILSADRLKAAAAAVKSSAKSYPAPFSAAIPGNSVDRLKAAGTCKDAKKKVLRATPASKQMISTSVKIFGVDIAINISGPGESSDGYTNSSSHEVVEEEEGDKEPVNRSSAAAKGKRRVQDSSSSRSSPSRKVREIGNSEIGVGKFAAESSKTSARVSTTHGTTALKNGRVRSSFSSIRGSAAESEAQNPFSSRRSGTNQRRLSAVKEVLRRRTAQLNRARRAESKNEAGSSETKKRRHHNSSRRSVWKRGSSANARASTPPDQEEQKGPSFNSGYHDDSSDLSIETDNSSAEEAEPISEDSDGEMDIAGGGPVLEDGQIDGNSLEFFRRLVEEASQVPDEVDPNPWEIPVPTRVPLSKPKFEMKNAVLNEAMYTGKVLSSISQLRALLESSSHNDRAKVMAVKSFFECVLSCFTGKNSCNAARKLVQDEFPECYFNGFQSIYGPLDGVEVGDVFGSRQEMDIIGLHRQLICGIDIITSERAFWYYPPESDIPVSVASSVIVSGLYADDRDDGDVIVYTGEGGQEKTNAIPTDQYLTKGNKALQNSFLLGLWVRVFRKQNVDGKSKGYVYAGMYKVVSFVRERSCVADYSRMVYKITLYRKPSGFEKPFPLI